MRCAPFWNITQRWVAVLYRRFGTNCPVLSSRDRHVVPKHRCRTASLRCVIPQKSAYLMDNIKNLRSLTENPTVQIAYLYVIWISNYMGHSPPSEASSTSASQETSFFQNSVVRYVFYKSLPLVPAKNLSNSEVLCFVIFRPFAVS
jgi:hypothetical protein